PLDVQGLSYALQQMLERAVIRFRTEPGDLGRIDYAERAARLVRAAPFPVDLGTTQNLFYELLQARYPEHAHLARQGDENSRAWVIRFVALGNALHIRVD
ncbi:MAG: glycoside hydrolase, partial [Planctomycetes bacterium]|nr:glycoside hydrolase [Planctomycetota bacterium]